MQLLYPFQKYLRVSIRFVLTLMLTSVFASYHAHAGILNPRLPDGTPAATMILPLMYAQNTYLKFILSSYGKSDAEKIQAEKNAESTIAKFAGQQRMLLLIDNLKELERIKTIYFPLFDSLDEEVQFRLREEPPPFFSLVGATEEVRDALEALWSAQQSRLAALANIPDALNSEIDNVSANLIINRIISNESKSDASKTVPPIAGHVGALNYSQLKLVNLIEAQFKKGIAQIDATGSVIAGSGELKHPDPSMVRFFELAIGEYFRNLEVVDKLNIISAFVNSPDRSSAKEKFEMMVLGSGPQFQKLFQAYAREKGFSESLKQTFKKLESSARSTPFRLVKQIIMAEKVLFEWVKIEPNPLGIGTMAQVHKAQIRLPSGEIKDVVVRVLKPGIAERLERDNKVLRILAPTIDQDPLLVRYRFPKIAPFINEIIAMGERELDVPSTVRAQLNAPKYYDREVIVNNGAGSGSQKVRFVFHVPKLYSISPTSNVMVQEYIPGTSFETFESLQAKSEAAPGQPQGVALQAIEELARLWLTETLLGSGFFHADLHQGNLRIEKIDARTVKINILDYGMSGQMTRELQNQMIGLSLIIGTRKADLMARALLDIALPDAGQPSVDQLTSLIQNEIQKQDLEPAPSSIGTWMNLAAVAGAKFPSEIAPLNRGLNYVTQMLENQGSKLALSSILKGPLLRNWSRWTEITGSLKSVRRSEWLQALMQPSPTPATSSPGSAQPPGKALMCRALFASSGRI